MRNILLVLALMVSACTTVEPGYVGVKVNNYGTQRGVQDIPIVTGRVAYNPVTEDIYKFPTFQQNEVWSKNPREGSDGDESITFNSIEGATVNVDIGVGVAFEAAKVPDIFLEFRKPPEQIVDIYVRNQVRDAFSRVASSMKITDIFGAKKQELITLVTDDLRTRLGPRGFKFDNISIVGEMRVDPTVKASINAVLSQSQRAVEAENKVKQAQAEAEQTIATARGDSASAVIAANGQAQANLILARSVTGQLIQYQTVQKWNGTLPTVTGGQSLITLPKP